MLNTGGRDPGEIATLIARLRERNPNSRRLARLAIVELGPQVQPSLERALRDDDWELRRQVAQTLGELGHPGSIPLLCSALADWDWEVRSEAAAGLLKLADAQAVGALVKGLADEHYRVRRRCLQALAQLEAREREAGREARALLAGAKEPLCELLRDSERTIRRDAAHLLSRVGGSEEVPPLLEALRDTDTEVRAAAVGALVTVGDSRAVLLLIAALNDQDMIRLRAAQALGRIAEREAAPGLEAALPRLRQLARSARWGTEIWGEDDPFGSAIARIEQALAHLRGLPLPAGAPPPSAAQLPRPGTAPVSDLAHLPRPALGSAETLSGVRRWSVLNVAITRILKSAWGILARREGRR